MSLCTNNEYLGKFSETGVPQGFLLKGVNYKTQEEEDAKIAEGWVKLTQDEWEYYTGNKGEGDNGTGYRRDPATGQPVSAPAKVWTKLELANIAASICSSAVKAIDNEIVQTKGLDPDDTETIEELEAARTAAEAKYAQQLDDIEAGIITKPSDMYENQEEEV